MYSPKYRTNFQAQKERTYVLRFEAGMIVALVLMIALFKLEYNPEQETFAMAEIQETVQMEEIVQTKQQDRVPPPPRPKVPVSVSNDEIIDDEILDIDAELDLDIALALPDAPPQEAEEEEPEVFVIVERMPELVGGIGALQKKVTYPEIARMAGIEGRVIIEFVIDERGNVTNPKVVRGIGGGCDEEALRAVSEVKFKPGMQRGRPVKVRYTLPVTFRLGKPNT